MIIIIITIIIIVVILIMWFLRFKTYKHQHARAIMQLKTKLKDVDVLKRYRIDDMTHLKKILLHQKHEIRLLQESIESLQNLSGSGSGGVVVNNNLTVQGDIIANLVSPVTGISSSVSLNTIVNQNLDFLYALTAAPT